MTSRQLNAKYKKRGIKVEYLGTTTHDCENGVRVWAIHDLKTGHHECVYYDLSDAENVINLIIDCRN